MGTNLKDGLQANADSATKLETARKINGVAFDGTSDITISASTTWDGISGKPATFTPADHNHDNRYFTETEGDNRYLLKTGKAVDADKLDGIDSLGFARAYSSSQNFGGNQNNITTPQFITMLDGLGAFASPYWVSRGSWSYASNQMIIDTGCGNIHLAGCTVEVVGAKSAFTIMIHTATTSSGGVINGDFIYVNNGDTYSPKWRRLYNTEFNPSYNDITDKPTSFPPSTHNHDTSYLGINAKASDSNLLDGKDSSAYATSTHTHSYLPLAGGNVTGEIISTKDFKTADGMGLVMGTDGGSIYKKIGGGVRITPNNDTLGVVISNKADTVDVLAVRDADMKFKGNVVWHAGNDGSGSGLNADLLDGRDSTYFSPTTHLHDDRYVPMIKASVEEIDGTKDMNNYVNTGMYNVSSDTEMANSPYYNRLTKNNYGQLICIKRNPEDNGVNQIFISQNGDIFTRVKVSNKNVWTNWTMQYCTNRGNVSDFNNTLDEGMWNVESGSNIPNAPYNDGTNGIWGVLEVYSKHTELFQRFTSNGCQIYIRFRNYTGAWSTWEKQSSDKDFKSNFNTNGYQKLPSGLIIQWGKVDVEMYGRWDRYGDITLPISVNAVLNISATVTGCSNGDSIWGDVSVKHKDNSTLSWTCIDQRQQSQNFVYAFEWMAICW